MDKIMLEYTIEAKLTVEAEDPQEISEVMDYLRESGEATIVAVKLVKDNKEIK